MRSSIKKRPVSTSREKNGEAKINASLKKQSGIWKRPKISAHFSDALFRLRRFSWQRRRSPNRLPRLLRQFYLQDGPFDILLRFSKCTTCVWKRCQHLSDSSENHWCFLLLSNNDLKIISILDLQYRYEWCKFVILANVYIIRTIILFILFLIII